MTEPVFRSEGGVYVPTGHSGGPWDPRMMHGGAPSALIAREVEAVAGPGFQLARLTVDFLGAVPKEPLTVKAEIWRPGRRMQLARATLALVDGREMCRADAVLLERQTLEGLPEGTIEPPLRPAPDELGPTEFEFLGDEGFGVTAMELRFAAGSWDPGPSKVWFRLRRPIVDDETPSPAVRAVAAADFANGISRILPFEDWLFINTDLTVALHRPPDGEWIGLDARTILDPSGVGLSISRLHAESGPVGTGQQTLYVSPRA